MLAVDTNVLVYAHRADSEFHEPAARSIRELAESRAPWAIPWPCLHEFYAIVTHPRIYRPASTSTQALNQIDAWVASPSLVLLTETSRHHEELSEAIRVSNCVGPAVHDARIAALCAENGVRELLTLDRDFARYPKLTTVSLLK
ncbi:MAG TPA: TA system VapC family ribonuclease toxin [Jatrophihabitantaceae bacterium]|nr:TA system VapC family ribonuclease toxin [Jatrophihabitantaceae bacterium]